MNKAIAIIIPAFNEHCFLNSCLSSIDRAWGHIKDSTEIKLSVYVYINSPQAYHTKTDNSDLFQSKQTHRDSLISYLQFMKDKLNFTLNWNDEHQYMQFGIGQARKNAFAQHQNLEDSDYLISLDADTWLASDFFIHFLNVIQSNLNHTYSFNFKHRHLKSDLSMIGYELYLRYLAVSYSLSGSSYSYIPLGSNFAITKKQYFLSGGFPLKNATEDFHLLKKIQKKSPIHYLKQCKVYPSARKSSRVFLGTGYYQQLDNDKKHLWIPKLKHFQCLKRLLQAIQSFYSNQSNLDDFLSTLNIHNSDQKESMQLFLTKLKAKLLNIIKHTSTEETYLQKQDELLDALDQLRFLKILTGQNKENAKVLYNQAIKAAQLKEDSKPLAILNYYRKQFNYGK